MHQFRVVIFDESGNDFVGMSQQLNWAQATLCRSFFYQQFRYQHAYIMVDDALSRSKYERLQFNFGFTMDARDGGTWLECHFKRRPWFITEGECHGK